MVSLRVSDLTHEFGDRVVFNSMNHVFDGACLAITGPNGSGKSTLVRIIAGLLTPTEGKVTIEVDGTELPRESVRDYVGLVAPDVHLYDELTARENLLFISQAKGLRLSNGRIDETLEEVGLKQRANDPVRELSSGLRQRACFAAALIHNPIMLLLDEPSTNLDQDGVEMVRGVIERYSRRGMVVLATNDPNEVDLGTAVLRLGGVS